LYTEQF